MTITLTWRLLPLVVLVLLFLYSVRGGPRTSNVQMVVALFAFFAAAAFTSGYLLAPSECMA